VAASAVYILSALTSLACAWILLRSYRRGRMRLLLWAGLAFLGFFLNNFLLIVDKTTGPSLDLSVVRLVPALVGVAFLIYGLVWELR
jgi:hypothetical protein